MLCKTNSKTQREGPKKGAFLARYAAYLEQSEESELSL